MSRELCLRNRQRTRAVDLPLLRRIARYLLSHHFGRDQFALAIHLIANPEMARLNEQFLGHVGSTDVIAFDLESAGAEPFWRSSLPLEKAGEFALPSQRRRRVKHRADKQYGGFLHGEIFISMDQALGQARSYRTTWQEELARYVIHALLHLHGYDDLTPQARRTMKRRENRLLREISVAFDLRGLKKRDSPSRLRT